MLMGGLCSSFVGFSFVLHFNLNYKCLKKKKSLVNFLFCFDNTYRIDWTLVFTTSLWMAVSLSGVTVTGSYTVKEVQILKSLNQWVMWAFTLPVSIQVEYGTDMNIWISVISTVLFMLEWVIWAFTLPVLIQVDCGTDMNICVS